MSGQVEIIHASVPGRARFHVPALRRSDALRRWLESELIGSFGIKQASASRLTGNVLVYYNPAIDLLSVADGISELAERFPAAASPGLLLGPDGIAKPVRDGDSNFMPVSPLRDLESTSDSWHQLSAAEVLKALETGPEGLSADEIAERLRRHGKNILPGAEPASALGTFVDQFRSLPVALLVGGAVLSFLTAGAGEAFVILGVVGFNAAIGFIFERRAEMTIQSLRSLTQPPAWVIRNGKMQSIDTDEAVPGDILILKPGALVPADGRIIEANRLRLNEAALTGESMPVSKHAEAVFGPETPVAERLNMVYRGTLVTGGSGLAMAVATGKSTELGRIHGLIQATEHHTTPLERKLDRLARQIVVISGCVWGLSLFVGILRGYRMLNILSASFSLAVAAIPEGLPTVTITTLALGIRNMRRHSVMVRRLEAVEALGSIEVFCFDKTGTVTLNEVKVIAIHAGMRRIDLSNGNITAHGVEINPLQSEEVLRLIQVGAVCSDTDVRREDGQLILNGPPMDNALLNLAIQAGVDVLELRKEHPVVAVRRGSADRKYMMSIHRDKRAGNSDAGLITVKGRPSAVLANCSWYIKDGLKLPLGEEDRREIEIELDRLSENAMRVVGLAYGKVDSLRGFPEQDPSDLTWLGVAGLADPVRPGAKKLINAFHQAGIATVMITGDRTAAAYSIAKELGIAGEGQIEILDSTHLRNLQPEVLSGLTGRIHVFARLSPSEKRQIVLALQRRGKVVAMTGDGINDTPALRAADIGIAMGKSGTVLAREVADIILEDDRLETMIMAVRQGRTINDNIRKSARYLLATTIGETVIRFAGIALGFGPSTQFLWANPIFPALALALEPPEPDVLMRPPRSSQKPLIGSDDLKKIASEGGMISLGAMGAYGYGLARYGAGARAGTIAMMGLSTAQLLHALNCRSENRTLFREGRTIEQPRPLNPYLWLSIGGTLFLQGIALFVPGLRTLFDLAPISLLDGAVIAAGAGLPLLINDAAKRPLRKLPAPSGAMIAAPTEPPG